MRLSNPFKRKPKECYDCFRKDNIMKMAARIIDTILVGKRINDLEPHDMMNLHTVSQALRFNLPLIATRRRGTPYKDRTGNEVDSMYEVLRNNFVHYMGMLTADIQAMFHHDSPIRDEIGDRYRRHAGVYQQTMALEMERAKQMEEELDNKSEENEPGEENG